MTQGIPVFLAAPDTGRHRSAGNSTETPLSSGATFTGVGELNGWPEVMVSCQTDNSGTLYFDFSVDGTNWGAFPVAGFAVASGIHEIHVAVKGPRWFRARLVNDTGAQSYLRLKTYYGVFRALNAPANQAVGQDVDTQTVRQMDFFQMVAQGLYTGFSHKLKFGRNIDIDAAEDIWEGGGIYTGFPTGSAETMDVFSSDAADTSNGTGARTVRLIGLDANGDEQTEDVTLNGITAVTTANTWTRCSRAYVLTAGSGGANAGVLTGRHTTTTANVFFAMVAGRNQTEVCADTVPANHKGYLYAVTVAGARANGTTIGNFSLRARDTGGVFRERMTLSAGNNVRGYETLKVPLVLDALTDFKVRCEDISAANGDFVARLQYLLVRS